MGGFTSGGEPRPSPRVDSSSSQDAPLQARWRGWHNGPVARTESRLLAGKRPKWLHLTMGVSLIVVAVALTVGWQILGTEVALVSRAGTWRWVIYFFGTLLSLLLIGGLGLLVFLLIREVRLNERQSNFVSAVTHELKTPVASLKLYLDTLQLREVNDQRRQEFYRTMRQDLDRLHATINNVLNAAMYTDRPVVDPQPLDLARLARRVIELTRTRYQLGPEAVSYRGPETLRLRGDADALETAVLNLLDNAVKYSRDPVQVEVVMEAPGDGQAVLRVRDNGVGISRSQLRLIFGRFYRIGSEVRRSHPGTGLGLFIVRSVAKGHKGTVAADSAGPDRGSTFTLTLPGVIDEAEELEGAPAPQADAR
jgi:two-component system, OmpR family, sensor histidine kinase SenX3